MSNLPQIFEKKCNCELNEPNISTQYLARCNTKHKFNSSVYQDLIGKTQEFELFQIDLNCCMSRETKKDSGFLK